MEGSARRVSTKVERIIRANAAQRTGRGTLLKKSHQIRTASPPANPPNTLIMAVVSPGNIAGRMNHNIHWMDTMIIAGLNRKFRGPE